MNKPNVSTIAKLDLEIRTVVQALNGKATLQDILDCLEEAANALAKPDVWGWRSGDRLIDRRLQKLRKEGHIVYGKKAWHLVDNSVNYPDNRRTNHSIGTS